MTRLVGVAGVVAMGALAVMPSARASDPLVVYRVTPSDTDPAIARYNTPHYIVFDPQRTASADLLVFMSGSGGIATGVLDFLTIAAEQGRRVVSLAYNDLPAVVMVCAQDPDPACSGKVRQKRIFGDNTTPRIDDTPAESVVNRLTKLLTALDRDHPSEGWAQYLDHGAPNWARLVIAGHSQGAGMAAFIAKQKRVARVILFSSPWDNYGRDKQIAPWVSGGPGVTPADRWFAAYHQKENTAALIARAYRALGVPEAHIRVLTREPARVIGENPYHLSVVGNAATPREAGGTPAYADQWRFLIGGARM